MGCQTRPNTVRMSSSTSTLIFYYYYFYYFFFVHKHNHQLTLLWLAFECKLSGGDWDKVNWMANNLSKLSERLLAVAISVYHIPTGKSNWKFQTWKTRKTHEKSSGFLKPFQQIKGAQFFRLCRKSHWTPDACEKLSSLSSYVGI